MATADAEVATIIIIQKTKYNIMALHNELGKRGEDLAVDMLVSKGYKILERNARLGDFEVDIIAMDDDTHVFVEVKTRSSDYFGQPEDAVDERRKFRISRFANAYRKFHHLDNPYRYDIVAIILNDQQCTINHIKDAFKHCTRPVGFHRSGWGTSNSSHKAHHNFRGFSHN